MTEEQGVCERWEIEVLDLAEDRLAAERREAVEAHVHACARCRSLLASASEFRAWSAEAPAESAPDAIWDRVAAGIAEEEGQAPRRRLVWLLPRVAAAAAALIGAVAWLAHRGDGRPDAQRFIVLHAPRSGSAEQALRRFFRSDKEVIPGITREHLAEKSEG